MADVQYIIRDAAGNTYGPTDLVTLKQWIRDHRVTPHMQIAVRGSNAYRPATAVEELREAFATSPYAHLYGLAQPARPTVEPVGQQRPFEPQPLHNVATGAAPTQYQAPAAPVPGQWQQQPQDPIAYAAPSGTQSGMAVASMILGICSIAMLLGCPYITPILSLVGVVLGHSAKAQIRRDPGRYSGEGMATAGLIMSYITLALAVLAIVAIIMVLVIAAAAPGRP